MGHTLSVHRNSYRLQDRTLELAKASKLFLAVDESHNYAGKTLDEITCTLEGKILFTCIKVCNAQPIFKKINYISNLSIINMLIRIWIPIQCLLLFYCDYSILRDPDNFLTQSVFTPWFSNKCWFFFSTKNEKGILPLDMLLVRCALFLIVWFVGNWKIYLNLLMKIKPQPISSC